MELNWYNAAIICLSVFIFVGLATAWLLRYLRQKAIMDVPNARSSHSVPVPRGGGLAVTGGVILGLAALFTLQGGQYWVYQPDMLEIWLVLAAMAGLAFMSWLDDRKPLPAMPRLAAHFVAAGMVLAVMPSDMLVFNGLVPLIVDRLLTLVAWVWFINLYNFMDGIDGITGAQTMCVGTGLILLQVGESVPQVMGMCGLLLVAVSLAFLFFNWHPARIFLGDVGSIPLGFVVGWLMIKLAGEGAWASAIILPMYYLADATVTLLWRAWRGKKVSEAHKEHFYQRALLRGANHAQVTKAIIKTNLFLIFLAATADHAENPVAFLIVAAAFVGTFMNRLLNWGEKQPTLKELKDDMIHDMRETYHESKENYRRTMERLEEAEKKQQQEEDLAKDDDKSPFETVDSDNGDDVSDKKDGDA